MAEEENWIRASNDVEAALELWKEAAKRADCYRKLLEELRGNWCNWYIPSALAKRIDEALKEE